MLLAGGVEVDGGVDGGAAGAEASGVGKWREEEVEGVLLLGEEVGLPAEA